MAEQSSFAPSIRALIPGLEKERVVTRTFRRLDPERQQAIIDAVLAEAVENGPDRIRIKEVARRAGASIGSLYQYFGSAAGLNAFAAQLGVAAMLELFRVSREALLQMPATEALRAYLAEGVKYFEDQQAYVRYFARAAYSGDPALAKSVVDPVAEAMWSTVRAIVEHGVQTGEFRADLDVEATARALHLLLTAAGDSLLLPHLNRYFRATAADEPAGRLFVALFDMVERGIAAPPRKPAPRRKAARGTAARRRTASRRAP